MSFELQFFGATGQVTGSLYALRSNGHLILLECGLVATGALLGLALVRPGRRRPFSRWMIVWMATFPLQVTIFAATLLIFT